MLFDSTNAETPSNSQAAAAGEGVAVVGMAGRFPGSRSLEGFWENIRQGVESISFFSKAELAAEGVDAALFERPQHVAAAGVLEQAEMFDAAFFGMTPREAIMTDPQQRLLLECSWEALEAAGYDSETYEGRVGIYAGMSMSPYLQHVNADPEYVRAAGSLQTTIGNDKDHLPLRISYKLNLRGPSVDVQTACSTSLVAVHLACRALLDDECDMALAGGVSLQPSQRRGYVYQEGGISSPDGHCRAFDAAARGTVPGYGLGLVVLKRLSRALQDGDNIRAVILGSAVNNDGSRRVGYTAPGVEGQAEVVSRALRRAGVTAASISYVEAHGTGTPLGDPIEIGALTQAFRAQTAEKSYCAIGSVKTNIGHLDAAAGVAGLIKTVLALEHKELPPSLHYREPNPQIDFANSPFYVNAELREWEATGTARRAGVSSFGIGGTNAHVILEEAPPGESARGTGGPQLLILSARTPSALEAASGNLAAHLRAHSHLDLADVSYTLQVGRRAFNHRRALVAHDLSDAVAMLEGDGVGRVSTSVVESHPQPVVFMYPGQGAQRVGMARGLYENYPVFREQVDLCSELLGSYLGLDLRRLIYPPDEAVGDAAQKLGQTFIAQPALFVVEYALTKLWIALGVRPRALVGHSLGEYVAACVAGVFTVDEALMLVAARGLLMQGMPTGRMLTVPLSEREVAPLLSDEISVAAVNGPSLCTVSGPHEALAEFEGRLAERGLECRSISTSHAFHSAAMEPVIAPFIELVRKVRLRPPQLPYISNVTGKWITAERATDPNYWGEHLRRPVRFADGIAELLKEPRAVLIEVGPGGGLCSLVGGHPLKTAGHGVHAPLRPRREGESDATSFLNTVGALWLTGARLDWSKLSGSRARRMALPTYPFERQRYYIAPPQRNQRAMSSTHEVPQATRRQSVVSMLREIMGGLFGRSPAELDTHIPLIEMGADSLFLLQASQAIQDKFGVKVPFRLLLEELSTIDLLAAHLEQKLPPEFASEAKTTVEEVFSDVTRTVVASDVSAEDDGRDASLHQLFAQQLKILSQQLELLRGERRAAENGHVATKSRSRSDADSRLAARAAQTPAGRVEPETFVPFRPIDKRADSGLNARRREHLNSLISRVCERTPGSKRLTQAYRHCLADSRVIAGFRPLWKEMAYPLMVERAEGSHIWDVDGNEYLDVTMGFGSLLFGHSPDFITEALQTQASKGMQIGPHSPLAGEVAQLICELTGVERVAFCNSGTEAVMTALRLARTVTGRTKVALFEGCYHGTFDGVLVRGVQNPEGQLRAAPMAPGVPPYMIEDVLMLKYNSAESLALLEAHAHELAAVLIEPPRSRRPDVRPKEFILELRRLTEKAGAALIFDEVVTGFRFHPGGAQALFDVKADLVTYGKAIGGGVPVAVIAGRAAFMDAVDGGAWQYGDTSYPEANITFFTGTYFKHPLIMPALWASLNYIKENSPRLQEELGAKAAYIAETLNAYFERADMPLQVACFGSLFRILHSPELQFADLLYYHLLHKGVYICETRNCFISTAHTDEDVEFFIRAVRESAEELRAGGFLPSAVLHKSARDGRPEPDGAPDSGEVLRIPVTESQRQVWALSQMAEEATRAYNLSWTLRLRGPLDVEAIRRAFGRIVERHEALRSTFGPRGDVQEITPALNTHIPLIDLSHLGADEQREQLAEWLEGETRRTFDLSRGPLFSALLLKLAADDFHLIFTMHHIVGDGWSFSIILKELKELYSAEREGRAAELPEPRRFSDYARQLAVAREDEQHWLDRFAEPIAPLNLPAGRSRPPLPTYAGAQLHASVNAATASALRLLSAREGCTLFMTLLAAFNTLLHHLTGQSDIVVGTPSAGQAAAGGGYLVGYCVNLLPLRTRVSDEQSFAEYMADVKSTLSDAYEHRHYPYARLQKRLDWLREPGRAPLVTAVFNLERSVPPQKFSDLTVEVLTNHNGTSKFDITLDVAELENGLTLACEYDTDLLDRRMTALWLEQYETILQVVAEQPDTQIGELREILREGERRRQAGARQQLTHARSAKFHSARRRPINR